MKTTIFATHDGTWHADDIMSAMMLRSLGYLVNRYSRDIIEEMKDSEIVLFDCGGGEFDHHQTNSKLRKNGIPYSSYGLLFDKFGEEYLTQLLQSAGYDSSPEIHAYFIKEIVEMIDCVDNGKSIVNYEFSWLVALLESINVYVGLSEEDTQIKNNLVEKYIQPIIAKIIGYRIIQMISEDLEITAAIHDRQIPEVLVLNSKLNWKNLVLKHNQDHKDIIKTVIFRRHDGDYTLEQVPVKSGVFELYTYLPEKWLSLDGYGLKFLHKAKFLAVFDSKELAISAAKNLYGVS